MATSAQQSPPATALHMLLKKRTFYNELFSFVRSIQKHNVFIIGGPMNAKIGKNVNNKFSLHILSNINMEYLKNFTIANGLSCQNTRFQKRKLKL